MTFAFVDTGGSSSGGSEVTPILPPAAEPGHLLVAVVDSGHPTSSTQPSTPQGWQLAGTVVGTSGTYGVDTGPRRLSIFLRVMQDGDDRPTFTIPPDTDSRVGAAIFAWSFGAGESVQWAVGFGEDTSSGTGFSTATTTTLALAPDDAVQASWIANTDAVTWSGEALTAAGITFAAVVELLDSQSTVGADVSRTTARSSVTAGTATGAVTLAATMSGAAIGVAGIIRLRDTATGGTAASATATYDDTLSRVRISASGMDAAADAARVERSIDAGATWTTVRGATAAPVVAGALVVPVDDFEFVDQTEAIYRVTGYTSASGVPTDVEDVTITPALFYVWLKSVPRPFLNTPVQVVSRNPGSITRPARVGVFDVVGRSFPVAVNDVRKSRRWVMYVRTETYEEANAVDLLLASGDVLYVHVPAGCPADIIPGGYVTVGDATVEWHPLRPESRLHIMPVVEVAPPSAEVTGAVGTYQTVLDTYATYAALLAAHTTYAELLALVGSPAEVIVP